MKTHVIVRTHEAVLKGKNRPMFVRRLEDNLRQAVRDLAVERVWRNHTSFGITLSDEADWPQVRQRVQDCFGVARFFPAYRVRQDLESVKRLLASELEKRSFDSFRITAHRTDKQFPMNSGEINRDLGAFVVQRTGARVDLTTPDLEIFVDVLHREILVYFDELRGYGGLPVGVSGKTLALLSGGIDSPVAAWHMMKRGSRASFVHFHSHPLVDTSSMEKATELVQLLTRYQYISTLLLVPFGQVQQRIIVSVPPQYRVILYRRFMVRIAQELARRHGAGALVTGESLAQVASQTLENIAVIDQAADMPVLRPLIGMNKEEIIETAREIGTFPVSIMPDQDCCSLFVPKHPVTRADPGIVRKLEDALPVAEMIEQAISEMQVREYAFPDRD